VTVRTFSYIYESHPGCAGSLVELASAGVEVYRLESSLPRLVTAFLCWVISCVDRRAHLLGEDAMSSAEYGQLRELAGRVANEGLADEVMGQLAEFTLKPEVQPTMCTGLEQYLSARFPTRSDWNAHDYYKLSILLVRVSISVVNILECVILCFVAIRLL
jgi:hypothetical protein